MLLVLALWKRLKLACFMLLGPYHISLSPGVACIKEALHLLQQAFEVCDAEGQGCFSSRGADICLTVLGSTLGGRPTL